MTLSSAALFPQVFFGGVVMSLLGALGRLGRQTPLETVLEELDESSSGARKRRQPDHRLPSTPPDEGLRTKRPRPSSKAWDRARMIRHKNKWKTLASRFHPAHPWPDGIRRPWFSTHSSSALPFLRSSHRRHPCRKSCRKSWRGWPPTAT